MAERKSYRLVETIRNGSDSERLTVSTTGPHYPEQPTQGETLESAPSYHRLYKTAL
jgi:hypothetical protein